VPALGDRKPRAGGDREEDRCWVSTGHRASVSDDSNPKMESIIATIPSLLLGSMFFSLRSNNCTAITVSLRHWQNLDILFQQIKNLQGAMATNNHNLWHVYLDHGSDRHKMDLQRALQCSTSEPGSGLRVSPGEQLG